jgi:hypothetical protein
MRPPPLRSRPAGSWPGATIQRFRPLSSAASRIRIVEHLVAHGADPTIRDELHRVTPLELAERNLRHNPASRDAIAIRDLLMRAGGALLA